MTGCATSARCIAFWPDYALAGADLHADVVAAVARCNQCLSGAGIPARLQLQLGEQLRHNEVAQQLASAALGADVCRLHAASAPGAAALWSLVRSLTLDNAPSQGDFALAVKLRLGVDVKDDSNSCRFCGLVADAAGWHALSCMSGGVSGRHPQPGPRCRL